MIVPNQLKDSRLIPLLRYSKRYKESWDNDTVYDIEKQDNITSYGIDLKRSNLVVLDCSITNDTDGVEKAFSLFEEKGYVPNTFSVSSPSGGLHFYFKAPKNISFEETKICDGVCLKTEGYMVGPGSIIKNDSDEEQEYILNDEESDIENLPNWIAKIVKKKDNRISQKTDEEVKENDEKTKEKLPSVVEQKQIVNWGITKVSRAEGKDRENTLNLISFFLGKTRVEEDRAREIITAGIEAGLTEKIATLKFENGYNDGFKEEIFDFDQAVKGFNLKTNTSPKDDPMDTGFYSHRALSVNFYQKYPNDYIYLGNTSSWYKYNEDYGIWEYVEESFVASKVDDFLNDLVNTIRKDYPRVSSQIYRLQEKLWVKSFVNDVAAMCRHRYLVYKADLFDNERDLLCCKNGVLNLKTGELTNHSPNYFMTKRVNVNYNPDVKDEYCDAVVSSIHPEERDYMQLLAGQALTGHQPKTQVALFLHGGGSNGKSTFMDLMLKTSGSYGKLQPPSVFVGESSSGDKYAIADFEGLRTAVVEELPNSKTLDTVALKRLVGTYRINSRAIYSANKEFLNQSTIFVSCNRLPVVDECDEGTWRRVLVINFPYSYRKMKAQVRSEWDRLGDPRVMFAAQNRTRTAEAFLAWRVEGAMKWYELERAEYIVPERILNNTMTWNKRNDPIMSWIDDCLDFETGVEFITFADLYVSYRDWMVDKNLSPVSQKTFKSAVMSHRDFVSHGVVYNGPARVRKGFVRSIYAADGYAPKSTRELEHYFAGVRFKKTDET